MSDEVNAQECAIQLARVCARLIRNARLLAELQSYRAPPRWPSIPIRHNDGNKSKVGSGLLLEFLTTKWKIDVDRLVHSDSADAGSLPSSQVATNLNEAIVDFKAARHDLKRLMPNANDVIDEPTILKLREPRNEQKFGNVQGTTMTEAVLEFSNEAVEKNGVSLIDAIRELGRLPEPKGKVVGRQICREFQLAESTMDQRETAGQSPDEAGYVRNPVDESAYVSATSILADHTPPEFRLTHKQLVGYIEDFSKNHIRWSRPLGDDGKPRSNRLTVHLADWAEYVKRRQPAEDDGTAKVLPKEIEEREAAIRATKAKGK